MALKQLKGQPWFTFEEIEKPEENRVIVMFFGSVPREGEQREGLDPEKETSAAGLWKQQYEARTGRMLLRWHKDPLAGGMRAQVQPKGQIWKGIPRFANAVVSQAEQNVIAERLASRDPGNAKPGNTLMVATAAWTGEWL